jgi:hypothetical protein
VKRACLIAALVLLAACHLERAASGRPPGTRTAADSLRAVEQDSAEVVAVETALRTYYRRFSSRSWRDFGLGFWPGATITTSWRPPGEGAERVVVQSVDDFARRAADGPGLLAAFSVEPVRLDVRAYGPLAVAWVVYRSRVGMRRDSVETHYGVDAFHLLKHRGEWRITALTFTTEVPGRPLAVSGP